MSVVSKNPFELLGDDEPRSSSPAPKAPAAAAPAAAQPAKVVPGAAPKGSGARGGRYPARGGPRNVYKDDRPVTEPTETFEGERVAAPKFAHRGKDRHTKGPREDRPPRAPRGPAGAGARGPKGAAGRAPRAAESGDKKPAENWTNEEGKADLNAEKEGEKEGAAEAVAPEATEEVEPEEEDNSKTLDQYLAERAEKALGGNLGKKEARQVTADSIEGKVFEREEEDAFFAGKAKEAKAKEAKAKKEKVFIEIDGQFARPERAPRGDDRAPRGRGGPRGGQRGQTRGAPRGAAPRAARQAPINPSDESAFPSLA